MLPENYFELFQQFPRPSYPYPELASPFMEQMREENGRWLSSEDYAFLSEYARKKYSEHRLTDVAARGFPFLTRFEQLCPIARFSTWGAYLDDYFDQVTTVEMEEVRAKAEAVLRGGYVPDSHDLGFYRQIALTRKECLAEGMPDEWYEKIVVSINGMLTGFVDEKRYTRSKTPPPLSAFLLIREQTSGGLPYCIFNRMQKNYRTLPVRVVEHPVILRIHALVSRLIGWHNDLISLPKELSRQDKGDVVNIVKVMQHTYQVPLEQAYHMAMELHEADLKELVSLHENLPYFGLHQELAYDYVQALGTMLHGVYCWHVKGNMRYRKGDYIEPEYNVKDIS